MKEETIKDPWIVLIVQVNLYKQTTSYMYYKFMKFFPFLFQVKEKEKKKKQKKEDIKLKTNNIMPHQTNLGFDIFAVRNKQT